MGRFPNKIQTIPYTRHTSFEISLDASYLRTAPSRLNVPFIRESLRRI